MNKNHRPPFLDLNIKQRNDPVATDVVYCDNSTIDDGSKCVQVSVGTKFVVSDVYGIKYDENSSTL